MLNKFLDRVEVKEMLVEAITQSKFVQKEIPNTFCGEKITQEQYCLYIILDALIKYYIILEDYEFNFYLDQLKRIIKKLQTHNDIVVAVNRLLIKLVKKKLGIKESANNQQEAIISYFYDKYIKQGYLYYGFSESFYDEEKGLDKDKYSKENEKVVPIQEILSKYKIDLDLDKESKYVKFTDSPLMASFYAYNSPQFLYKLGLNLIIKNDKKNLPNNSFFFREYHTCLSKLDTLLKKKEISLVEKNRIIAFFKDEWKELKKVSEKPMIAFIKRNKLHQDYLDDYKELIATEDDVESIIHNILNIKRNDYEDIYNILPDFYIKLPNVNDLLNKEENLEEKPEETFNIDNSYGSATFLAIIGLSLIALGIFLTIIMMGR